MVCCMCDLVGEYACVSMSDVFPYYPIFSLKTGSLTELIVCLASELPGSACLCLLVPELKMRIIITGFLCGC